MGNTARALLALAFTIFIWGVAPAFVRGFSLTTGPSDAIVIRMWTTAIAALPLFLVSGWRIAWADVPMMVVIGSVGMFGYFVGSIFGYALVPAGFGSMIIAVQPLLIALIAAAIGTERMTLNAVIGLIISFGGTLYLFGGNMSGATAFSNLVEGGVLILLCDICWAIYVVYSKPLLQKYGTFKMTAWTLFLCGPPSLVFISHSTLSSFVSLNAQSLFSLFFLSVIATVLCVVTWNYATKFLSATTMGASFYLIPVLAVASGWLVLGEQATYATLIAGAVILAGVAVAEFGNARKSA
jgi:drug/metabolite transporter (DMT)-like permease